MREPVKRANTATSPEGQRARPSTVQVPAANDRELGRVIEMEFVTQWYHLAYRKEAVAMEMVQHVPPEAIEDIFWREAYRHLGEVFARGEQVESMPAQLHVQNLASSIPGGAAQFEMLDNYLVVPHTSEDLRGFGRQVIARHRSRVQQDLLFGAYELTRKAAQTGTSVRKISDNLMDNLINLHTKLGDNAGPVTQEEIADHLLAKLSKDKPAGYNWPWPKLQKVMGIISPGKVIGVTAYSGNGKTMFVCNLFRELVIRGIPVIIFPTEMDLQWIERVVASLARVPKEYAEEGDWRNASDEEITRYRDAMQALIGLQWDIVQQPGISPAEIIARTRVLRRKYRGQQVVVIVDHMHRLDYPGGVSADDALGAGKATADMKNSARSDRDGGLTYIPLFQPKKPREEADQFRPVSGATGIRGHGSAYNEVDIHISPWRRVVKCTEAVRTEWGTPLAIYDKDTDIRPASGTFGEEGTKLDDEHVYLTVDKHRVRGASLETIMLNMHAPSGFMYEQDYLRSVYRKRTPEELGE